MPRNYSKYTKKIRRNKKGGSIRKLHNNMRHRDAVAEYEAMRKRTPSQRDFADRKRKGELLTKETARPLLGEMREMEQFKSMNKTQQINLLSNFMPKDIAKSEVGYWNKHVHKVDNSQLWAELNKTAFMCDSINHLNLLQKDRWVAKLVKSSMKSKTKRTMSPPNTPPTSPVIDRITPEIPSELFKPSKPRSKIPSGLFNVESGALGRKPKNTKRKKKGRKKTPKRFY